MDNVDKAILNLMREYLKWVKENKKIDNVETFIYWCEYIKSNTK